MVPDLHGRIHHGWHVAILRLPVWEYLLGRMSRSAHVTCSGVDVSSGTPLPRSVGAPNAIGSFVDVDISLVRVCLFADAGVLLVLTC